MRLRLCFFLLLLPMAALSAAVEDARYNVDPRQSFIHVLVYRAGMLSGLGHNHVVSTHALEGEIVGGSQPAATLQFAVASLVVDEPAARDMEGDDFPGEVSSEDIQKTRANMLGRKLLDNATYPQIVVRSTSISGVSGEVDVEAEISVRDFAGTLAFPATIAFADGSIVVEGLAEVNHRDLGLKRFSAAFGTLKVAEKMLVRFHIVARPAGEATVN